MLFRSCERVHRGSEAASDLTFPRLHNETCRVCARQFHLRRLRLISVQLLDDGRSWGDGSSSSSFKSTFTDNWTLRWLRRPPCTPLVEALPIVRFYGLLRLRCCSKPPRIDGGRFVDPAIGFALG